MACIIGTAWALYPDGINAITGEQNCTLNIAVENYDGNSKSNPDWDSNCPGRASFDFSVAGLVEPGDTGYEAVRDSHLNRTAITFKIKTVNAEMYSGTANPTAFSKTGDHGALMTFSGNFKGTGTLVHGAAS